MNILDEAIVFAVKAHDGAVRKGGSVPYIVHPMEAAAIAAGITDDIEIVAAAVLHDVVEDTSVSEREIARLFGERVAALVMADSEDKRNGRTELSWEERKAETLARIRSLDRDGQIIVLSDKLSNLRSIFCDLSKIGESVWEKFNVKDREKQGRYYCGVADRLDKVKDTVAYGEFVRLLSEVFGYTRR